MSSTTTTTTRVVLQVDDTSTLSLGCWPLLSYQPQRLCPPPNVGLARGLAALSQQRTQAAPLLSDVFQPGLVHLQWSPATLHTPPLTWRTTFVACALPVMRVPALPPGCAVHILTDALHGTVDTRTGECTLLYDARYVCRVQGGLYTSPELRVCTTLTSDGDGGRRLDSQGRGSIVGAATIGTTEDWLCNMLLSLPTTCSTRLDVRLKVFHDEE